MIAIQNNPYRLLGVYANSPVKERVANHHRLKAVLNVGKQMEFPLDLPHYLPPAERTADSIAQAEASLTLPGEQVKHAQFWFLKITPIDQVAFNHLFIGQMDEAVAMWDKKECASSLQNKTVCALLQRDYRTAIDCAERLYTQYAEAFLAAVVGDSYPGTAEELAWGFLDSLCREAGMDAILPFVHHEDWKKHLMEQAVNPLIDQIQSAIATAQAAKHSDPEARYQAGLTLMNDTASPLLQLGTLLPPTDLSYQLIADKLALELLQCGIDYFNNTHDNNAPQKAAVLQKHALSIAVGNQAKERCRKNMQILERIGKEHAVREEMEQLAQLIKKLRGEETEESLLRIPKGIPKAFLWSISDIQNSVNQCLPHLKSIATKLGKDNKEYIQVSSAVVAAAVNALVEVVNSNQSFCAINNNVDGLRDIISKAVAFMTSLANLDMNAEARTYYNNNKNKLLEISNSLPRASVRRRPSTNTTIFSTYTNKQTSPKKWKYYVVIGCFYSVVVIVFIIFLLLFFSPLFLL